MSNTTDVARVGALVLVAVVLLALVSLFGTGAGMMGGGHMWGSGSGAPGWMFLVGVVMQLLVLIVLAGGAVALYRALSTDGEREDEAVEEVRLAYARGDLTDEEFEQRRERLR